MIKADTDEGFCFRSMLQGRFARLVHTGEHSVGACSILWYTRGSRRKLFFNFRWDLVSKYLTNLILWSILLGGNHDAKNALRQ